MNISPTNSVLLSVLDSFPKTEKMATPMVIKSASTYWDLGYIVPFNNFPIIMTGMIFDDLKTVFTGKETYRREAYCDQLLIVFDRAQGVNARRGATLLSSTDPCRSFTDIMATMIARKRFEKTQKAADGNFPSGAFAVGVNLVDMMSSCIYPHVR